MNPNYDCMKIIVKFMQDRHNMLGLQIYYSTYHHS
uniref:Uncharacterized protein n=1 Tax=Anguilla anguilla TaxID=7936 RepID=A0A0E9XVB8_ANGAN